jgi:hypothetical protein
MKIKELYKKTIDNMLRLKYMVGIHEYLYGKTKANYQDFELEFEADSYPVHAPEMKSSIALLEKWVKIKDNRIFFESKKIISSWDTADELAGNIIPYEKMFFLHFFILLEGFGNNLVKIINEPLFNKISNDGKSWHSSIHKFNNNINDNNIERFKRIFNIQSLLPPNEFIDLLLCIKEKRNKIAHENNYDSKYFHSDIKSILIIISYLYFSVTNDNDEITIFPWKNNTDWMDI